MMSHMSAMVPTISRPNVYKDRQPSVDPSHNDMLANKTNKNHFVDKYVCIYHFSSFKIDMNHISGQIVICLEPKVLFLTYCLDLESCAGCSGWDGWFGGIMWMWVEFRSRSSSVICGHLTSCSNPGLAITLSQIQNGNWSHESTVLQHPPQLLVVCHTANVYRLCTIQSPSGIHTYVLLVGSHNVRCKREFVCQSGAYGVPIVSCNTLHTLSPPQTHLATDRAHCSHSFHHHRAATGHQVFPLS